MSKYLSYYYNLISVNSCVPSLSLLSSVSGSSDGCSFPKCKHGTNQTATQLKCMKGQETSERECCPAGFPAVLLRSRVLQDLFLIWTSDSSVTSWFYTSVICTIFNFQGLYIVYLFQEIYCSCTCFIINQHIALFLITHVVLCDYVETLLLSLEVEVGK